MAHVERIRKASDASSQTSSAPSDEDVVRARSRAVSPTPSAAHPFVQEPTSYLGQNVLESPKHDANLQLPGRTLSPPLASPRPSPSPTPGTERFRASVQKVCFQYLVLHVCKACVMAYRKHIRELHPRSKCSKLFLCSHQKCAIRGQKHPSSSPSRSRKLAWRLLCGARTPWTGRADRLLLEHLP